MKRTLSLCALAVLLFVSCDNKPTLQRYFVEKAEAKDFIATDIAPSILKTQSMALTAEEKKAFEALHTINILMFKATDKNGAEYEKQKTEVKQLLKTDNYEELVKFNNGIMGVSVNTKGEGSRIEEFVVFLNEKTNGFGIIRVAGKNMTPNTVMAIVELLQKTNLPVEQLKPLQQLMHSKM